MECSRHPEVELKIVGYDEDGTPQYYCWKCKEVLTK